MKDSVEKLHENILQNKPVTIEEFLQLIEECKVYEVIKHTPKGWWNEELTNIAKAVNKLKKKKSELGENSPRREEIKADLKNKEKQFKMIRNKYKRLFIRAEIEKTAEDPTGRLLYKTVKRLQPGLNKKKKHWKTNDIRAMEEATKIADSFADISNAEDLPSQEDNSNIEIPEQIEPVPEITDYEITNLKELRE